MCNIIRNLCKHNYMQRVAANSLNRVIKQKNLNINLIQKIHHAKYFLIK